MLEVVKLVAVLVLFSFSCNWNNNFWWFMSEALCNVELIYGRVCNDCGQSLAQIMDVVMVVSCVACGTIVLSQRFNALVNSIRYSAALCECDVSGVPMWVAVTVPVFSGALQFGIRARLC